MKTKQKVKRSRAMLQVSEAHKTEIRGIGIVHDLPSRIVLAALIEYGIAQYCKGKVKISKPSLS